MPPETDLVEVLIPCRRCNEEFSPEDSDDEELCQDCYDSRSLCAECDEELWDERHSRQRVYTNNDGDTYCENCYYEKYSHCAHCNEEIETASTWNACGDSYCEACYEDLYISCDGCGDIISRDDSYGGSDGNSYCRDCYHEDDEESSYSPYIREYHSRRPRLQFHRIGEPNTLICEPLPYGSALYLGVELEVDEFDGDDMPACADKLHRLSHDERLFHMETDGSINYGFEVISQPCTLEYHLTEFGWKELSEIVVNYGGRSHNTSTCGLHIHFNKTFFGVTEKANDLHSLKLLYLFEKFWEQFVIFSRRRGESWIHYAERYNETFDTVGKVAHLKNGNYGRYFAVNIQPEDTIELRIFRGTLNINTLFATLELVDFLVRYCKRHTISLVQTLTWEKLVEAIPSKYEYLLKYLESINLKHSETIIEGGVPNVFDSEQA